MQVFELFLRTVIGAVFSFTIALFGGAHVSYTAPLPSPTAAIHASTTAILPIAPTAPKVVSEAPKAPVVAAPVETPVPSLPTISADELNTNTRQALVNILCTTRNGGYLSPITGTGVIIDPRGVILTPAHVAQFFLMRDYLIPRNVECTVRTGSPAQPVYTAELLYLPSAWVDTNASQIISSQPMGTGENDYAFLLITGRTDPQATLPASFPYLSPTLSDPKTSDQMLLASYPAGFLDGITIEKNLYQTSAYANVGQLYIFNDGTPWIELFSVPGTILSQAGSSGGAAVRVTDGLLAGIVVTSTSASTTAQRDLRAITIDHIDHSLQTAGQNGITSLLSGNLLAKAFDFNQNTAPILEEKIAKAISSQN